jgi:hypothetical protein
MASPVNAFLCALIAVAFWTLLGFALARHLLPRALALGAAAVIGWAVHSAVTLPIYVWIGFSPVTVVAIGALCILASGFSLSLRASESQAPDAPSIPLWAFAAAAILALAPAVAILPKFYGDAVQLADQIFDHSKSAIVDVIARLGVPPINPIFGEFGGPERLPYYYLWHFSAAEIAAVTGAMGWEADIGLTWFTAFASLALMMGVAVWLAQRSAAAIWVVVFAGAASLWITLYWILGTNDLTPVLRKPIGMAGWLSQATWAPQHLMAAACVLTTMLLLARLSERQSWTLVLTLALLVVAAFESSAFVGGITFALAAIVAAPFLLAATKPSRRGRLIAALSLAALLVVCLIAPFVLDQFAAIHARGDGRAPIILAPYRVFGEFLPPTLRRVLDLPGYWLVILPVELPAVFFAGLAALTVALRSDRPRPEKLAVTALACLAGAGLVVPWLLVDTLGHNNDLGLRAIIPAEMVLIASVAVAASAAKIRFRVITVTIALIGLALSLPDMVTTIQDNVAGEQRPGGVTLARSPDIWVAVRRYAPPAARVANNPLFVKDVTPWPVNISWALLANRSSCFADLDLALAFTALPAESREAINAQFVRVFAGEGTAADVHAMATQYRCDVVVVVPSDKAWEHDPFAASPDYRLAETRTDRWRIYVRK